VYRVDRETAEVEQLTSGRNIAAVSFSADCSVWAYTAGDGTHLEELWIRDGDGDRRVTLFNDELLGELRLSKPVHYTFKNELGDEVDAWMIKPPGFKPDERYPVVLKIHGGPTGVYGDAMFHEMQVLAAEGYVVIYTNPRGSGGYGEEYTACQQGHYGEVDLADLDAFVDDALKRFGFLDSERQGVIGGSYGGSIVNLWITRTNRFKTAVACRSQSNVLSYHGSGISGWTQGLSGRMGFPWKDADHLLKLSPVVHAAKIKTPLLLIHSELDGNNRITEPEQLLVALRELGVDVELVVFPDQGHPLPRTGKPQLREERIQNILRWLDKYLKT
jgi:dipeptidyl aminopeptidase/acylaminoacyl peptidase